MEKTINKVIYISSKEEDRDSCDGCVACNNNELCSELLPCHGIIWKVKEQSDTNKYQIAQEVHKEYVAGWSPGDTTKFEDWLNKKILESDCEYAEYVRLKSKFENK